MTLRERVRQALERGRPEAAWDVAAAAWNGGSAQQRHHAWLLLRHVVQKIPQSSWTEPRAAVARQAEIDPRTPEPRVGVVAFPAVAGETGCFIDVAVTVASEDSLPDGLTPSSERAALAALAAARRLAPDTRFAVRLPTAPDFEGGSWGLALGLAALSAAHTVALPDRVTATGGLDEDGTIADVTHKPKKLRLRQDARPRAMLLGPANWSDVASPDVRLFPTLAKAWASLVPDTEDLDAALRDLRSLDRNGDWQGAAARAFDLIDGDVDQQERIWLLVLLLQAANHRADTDVQQRWSRALATESDRGCDERVIARTLGSRIISAIDRFDTEAAEALVASAGHRPWGDAAKVHVRGSQALLWTLQGRHDDALTIRKENATLAGLDERARCLGDLADAYLRVDAPDQALRAVLDAFEAADAARSRLPYQRQTKAYLALHHARALQALSRPDDARTVLTEVEGSPGIDPQLRHRLLQAELIGDSGLVHARWQALPTWATRSPVICALFERTRARLGDRDAHTTLLSRDVFEDLDLVEAARRLPY